MNNLLSFDVSRHRGEIGSVSAIERMVDKASHAYAEQAKGTPPGSIEWRKFETTVDVQFQLIAILKETRHLRCDIAMGEVQDAQET